MAAAARAGAADRGAACPRVYYQQQRASRGLSATAAPARRYGRQLRHGFPTSFHGDRHGKATFYSAPDGFSQLTGIPIEQLACVKCHSPTYTDGTTVDAATYTASCRDCHVDPDKPADNPVTDQICDVRAAGEAVRDLPVAAAARLHSQASGPAASHVGVRRCVSRRAGDRALLAASTRALRGLGFRELVRTFLVGNAEATLWHWRCGFRPAW